MVKGSLNELTREECFSYLRGAGVGRIAVSRVGDGPLVVPVNFVVDGDDVVFRSDPGTKVDAMRDTLVSFQIDQVDPFHRTGWSVLVTGLVAEVGDEGTTDLDVEPWAEGEKRLWFRLVASSVSGRRIDLPEIEMDERGYL